MTTAASGPSPGMTARRFSDVDAGPAEEQAGAMLALDVQAQSPAIRRLRAWALERMQVEPGMSVLDVGCGTGEDARGLAVSVAPTGRAVGVDASRTMVDEARRRAAALGSSAQFETASATELPFDDASFDAVRCERVLQHLTDPATAVGEMSRVLRPGGSLVLIDTDWRTCAAWPADTATHLAFAATVIDSVATPAAGAALPGWLLDAGLVVVALTSETLLARGASVADRPPLSSALASAVRTGALSQEEADAAAGRFRAAAARGAFMGSVTMFAASGRRP